MLFHDGEMDGITRRQPLAGSGIQVQHGRGRLPGQRQAEKPYVPNQEKTQP